MKNHPTSTLILGLGSILHKDDGVGVRVVEYLQKCPLPETVELVDGTSLNGNFINILCHRKLAVIIDAATISGPPGTYMRLTPSDWLDNSDDTPALHHLDIPQTLAMAHLMGFAPHNVICVGVVPESVNPGTELTDTLNPLVPRIADMVLDEIQSQ